ncbi:MAG: acyl carrier protein [Bacteroidota bacterium]
MTNNINTIREKVKSYILQSVHVEKDKISNNSLIFKEGYIDSMGFIMLITFMEDEFAINTVDEDLVEENFESINAISDFIYKKRQD